MREMLFVIIWLLFFFFQAEDGIRDDLVTGVQTCALPILRLFRATNCSTPRRRNCVMEKGPHPPLSLGERRTAAPPVREKQARRVRAEISHRRARSKSSAKIFHSINRWPRSSTPSPNSAGPTRRKI